MNNNNKGGNIPGKVQYHLVWLYLLGIDLILSPIFQTMGQMGLNLYDGFKYIYILISVYITMYIFVKGKFILNNISRLFIYFFPLSLILGLLINDINKSSFSHIYTFILPIVAISFGMYMGEYVNEKKYIKILTSIINLVFYSNLAFVILYKILFKLRIVPYPAITVMGLFFASLLYLYNGNKTKFLLSLFGLIVSEKRSTLVIVVISIVYYFYRIGKLNFKNKVKNMIILTLGAVIFVYLYNNTPYLSRFALTFNNLDFSDSYSLYLATGGRSDELSIFLDVLNTNKWMWFIGGGIGYNIEIYENFFRHYSHFTPLGYTMLCGIFFTIILYILFINLWIKKIKLNDFRFVFKLFYIGLFINSFFGGSLFNDSKFWIICGVVASINYNKFIEIE